MNLEYQQKMKKIPHNKISESALQSIKLYILDNNLQTGDILPSENVLSEILGISRTSLREAFKSLEALGILNTIQGKGRFLRDFNYEAMVEHLSYNLKIHVNNFREIIDVRMALEEKFLSKTVLQMPEEEIKELEAILHIMETQINNGEPEIEIVNTHTLFHQTLYIQLNNTLLNNLIGVFATFQRSLTILKRYKTSNYADFLTQHQYIIDLIKSRDVTRVEQCLQQHFKDVINWSNEHQSKMF
ncbi:MAG: FadR family transcriptional regulator [Sphaerochaeta sp.]|nr:FadR family transcriptional regulator [Sphaerochaeta sp.]